MSLDINKKNKAIFSVMLLIVTICTIFISFSMRHTRAAIDYHIRNITKSARSVVEVIVDQKNSQYQKRIKILVNQKASPSREKMLKAFYERDRNELLKISRNYFEILKDENTYFSTFGWVLPDNHAFLRLHSPQKFGDDVSKMRPDIVAVNQEKRQFYGFTVGYSGMRYRIAQPVFYNGEHIGAIQFGLDDGFLLDAISEKLNTPVGMIIPNEKFKFIGKSSLPHWVSGNYTIQSRNLSLFENQIPRFEDWQEEYLQLELQKKQFVITPVLGLKNYSGQTQGHIFVALDISEEITQGRRHIFFALISSMIILISSFVILNTSYGAMVEKIVLLNNSLKQNNLELESRVEERTNELSKANDALLDSEVRFRTLSGAAFEGIAISEKGIIVEANDRLCKMLDYNPTELIGKAVADIILPEERARVKSTMLSGDEQTHETRCLKKDGSALFIEVQSKIFSYQGRQVRVSAIRDLSAQKGLETKLRRFKYTLDQAHDCVFMFEPDTLRFFYTNQGAIDQVGYTIEELQQMTPIDIKPEFSEDRFREMVAPLIKKDKPSLRFETVHKHKDGTLIPVDVFLQYVAPTEEEGRFVAIVRDISEQKKVENTLRVYAEKQKTLLREVNHRVKNNLTAIISMLHQESDRAIVEEGQQELNSRLEEIVGRVSGLLTVHSLLSAAKWEPLPLHQTTVSIINESLKGADVRKSIKVNVLPSDILVNSDQAHYLAIVLNELTTNSMKYAMQNKDSMNINVSISHNESSVLLIYQDDGPGYPELVLKGEIPSRCIGFNLVNGIVKKSMQGNVGFDNENGATTRITFPKVI